ncbi:hypothetical protein OG413_46320 [Streptomyces sp. NBC_01433]|uniref:hypothetical protein n=1 Tax=Streptomyces sp. NBC_01433 TaxID=2903864 RepID=UPI00224D5EC8|nr:hypothetical protein [Streptomyces sp. NBC_01433]MCX4682604.1 hypothetical protein [Streptomyces sp. NBC_01433]
MSTTRRPLGTGPQPSPLTPDTAVPRPGTAADRAADQPRSAVDGDGDGERQLAPRGMRRPLGPGPADVVP